MFFKPASVHVGGLFKRKGKGKRKILCVKHVPDTAANIKIVNGSSFHGTCYKAASWIFLGLTQGFGKSAKRYYHHGQPKTVIETAGLKMVKHYRIQ